MKLPPFYQAVSDFEAGKHQQAYDAFLTARANGNIIAPHYIHHLETFSSKYQIDVAANTTLASSDTSSSQTVSSSSQAASAINLPDINSLPIDEYPGKICHASNWLSISLNMKELNTLKSQKQTKKIKKKIVTFVKNINAHADKAELHALMLLSKIYLTNDYVRADPGKSARALAMAAYYGDVEAILTISKQTYADALPQCPSLAAFDVERAKLRTNLTVQLDKPVCDALMTLAEQEPKQSSRRQGLLRLCAALGHAKAQFILGQLNFSGERLKWLNHAGLQGHSDALKQLVYLYSKTEPRSSTNDNLCAEWLIKTFACQAPNDAARREVLERGLGVLVNLRRTSDPRFAPYIHEAAAAGISSGIFVKAMNTLDDKHASADEIESAIASLDDYIENNRDNTNDVANINANLKLAMLYRDGLSTSLHTLARDPELALKYFKMTYKLGNREDTICWDLAILHRELGDDANYRLMCDAAAQLGNPSAIAAKATELSSEQSNDDASGTKLIAQLKKITQSSRATKKEKKEAYHKLAFVYIKGENEIPPNLTKAIEYVNQVANLDPSGNHSMLLAILYERLAAEKPKHYKKAVKYYKAAFEHDTTQGDALNNMTNILWRGLGYKGPQITSRTALNNFTRAKQLGCDVSAYNRGLIFFEGGAGVEKDIHAALHEFEEAVNQGDSDALFELSLCHKALGNTRELHQSLKRGVNQGVVKCIHAMGMQLLQSAIDERSRMKGRYYLEIAADNGYDLSQYVYAIMTLSQSPDDDRLTAEAMTYLHAAADGGYLPAVNALNYFQKGESPEGGDFQEMLYDLCAMLGAPMEALEEDVSVSDSDEASDDALDEVQLHGSSAADDGDNEVAGAKRPLSAHPGDNHHSGEPAMVAVKSDIDDTISSASSYQRLTGALPKMTIPTRDARLRQRIEDFLDPRNKKNVTMHEFLQIVTDLQSQPGDFISHKTRSSRVRMQVNGKKFSIHKPHAKGRSKREQLDPGRIGSMRDFIESVSTSSNLSDSTTPNY